MKSKISICRVGKNLLRSKNSLYMAWRPHITHSARRRLDACSLVVLSRSSRGDFDRRGRSNSEKGAGGAKPGTGAKQTAYEPGEEGIMGQPQRSQKKFPLQQIDFVALLCYTCFSSEQSIGSCGGSTMVNPWEEISLSDYENHMKLDSVMQLQNMNQMMKGQLNAYPVSSAMILGIAGGNGLEHIDKNKYQKVYGIDINREYLAAVKERYSDISDILECIQLDLIEETYKLPKAELLIANLLIEYIGYTYFQKAVEQVQPQYVSCIIQINVDDNWVSDSPYIHVFDCLDQVHHQLEESPLVQVMNGIGYKQIAQIENPLPNGKKLVQLDFELCSSLSGN